MGRKNRYKQATMYQPVFTEEMEKRYDDYRELAALGDQVKDEYKDTKKAFFKENRENDGYKGLKVRQHRDLHPMASDWEKFREQEADGRDKLMGHHPNSAPGHKSRLGHEGAIKWAKEDAVWAKGLKEEHHTKGKMYLLPTAQQQQQQTTASSPTVQVDEDGFQKVESKKRGRRN